jgi:ATP-dependent DNA ligase
MPHIIEALREKVRNGIIRTPIAADGELYAHKYKDNFEELIHFIRSEEPAKGSEVVQYYVYDIADASKKFSDRLLEFGTWRDIKHNPDSTIQIVDTFIVNNNEEAVGFMKKFMDKGYEGAMIRNGFSRYEFKRSYNLQKIKTMLDSEFKIIDVNPGRGKMAECGIFTCEDGNGGTFDCKCEGSLESLKEFLVNKHKYVGRMLTVRYQGKTVAGSLRFPIGVRVREDI